MPRPIIVGTSSIAGGYGTSSVSSNFTANAAANYAIGFGGAQNVSGNTFSGTYGGEALTMLIRQAYPNNYAGIALLGKPNPLTGSRSWGVSVTNGTIRVIGATFLSGVDVTTPVGNFTSSFLSTVTTASITVASNPDALCVMAIFSGDGNRTYTASIGETILTQYTDGAWSAALVAKNGEESTSFATTVSSAHSFNIAVVSINGIPRSNRGNFIQGSPFILNQSTSTGTLMVITDA